MPHTYASTDEFKKFLVDGGTSAGTANDATLLAILEGASRTVDGYCNRSAFGSGFGPRTASNRYDSAGRSYLDLRDDFLTISSVSMLDGTGGSSSALTEETDYYSQPYASARKRRLQLHGLTTSLFSEGLRVLTVAGVAGYSNETVTATGTVNEALDTTETGIDVSATTSLSIGQTWLIGSEQMYVTALSSTTFTVKRGQNGSTAATHDSAAAIAYYVYPQEVVTGTLLVAQRRWKQRDAGLTPVFDGQGIPGTQHSASEWTLLHSTLWHLRIPNVA